MAKQSSRFDYFKSRQIPELTVLQAALSDFSYDRHAHEEYAFGVTLAGRQDFFSGGQFHRSPPGNVIQFNPEQVHDGHPGDDSTLGYVMLYVPSAQLEASFADAAGGEWAARFRSGETLMADAELRGAILELAHLMTRQVGTRIDQEHALHRMATRLVQRAGQFQPGGRVSRPDRCCCAPRRTSSRTSRRICRWTRSARPPTSRSTTSCACSVSSSVSRRTSTCSAAG